MMNPGPNNIDSLLGLGLSKGGSVDSKTTVGKVAGQRFASILDLLASAGNDRSARIGIDLTAQMTGRKSTGETGIDKKKVNLAQMPTNDSSLLTVSDGSELVEQARPDVSGIVKVQDSATVLSGKNGEANVVSSLPASGTISNQRLDELLHGKTTPVELVSGKYEVVQAELEGEDLVLDVRSLDGQQIKVTVPASLIDNPKSQKGASLDDRTAVRATALKTSAPARIELNSAGISDKSRLNEMFAKLNITDLEISDVEPVLKGTARQVGTGAVDVKLVAEHSGQEIRIKSRIQKRNVRAEVKANRRAGNIVSTHPRVAQSQSETTGSATSAAKQNIGGELSSPERFQAAIGEAILSENLQGGAEKMDSSGDRLSIDPTVESLPRSNRVVFERSLHSVPRFSLPDDLAKSLKPNGRSVALTIQPENLGPARLRLAMSNNTLTAHLTVESNEARAVVEASLDELTSQLEKAGIRVGQVDVSLSGGDFGGQQFEHRAAWGKSSRSGRNRIEETMTAEAVEHNATPIWQAPTYVRADQVNVFA